MIFASSSSVSSSPLLLFSFFFCLFINPFWTCTASPETSEGVSSSSLPRSIYACTGGDPTFLGEYLPVLPETNNQEEDTTTSTTEESEGITGTGERGSFIYTNEEGRSIWQNRGFWYVGDMTSWPPETYFRCMHMPCTFAIEYPSLEGYVAAKEYEDITPPTFQEGSCEIQIA